MQRAKKILLRCVIVILAICIGVSITIHIPFVQRIIVTKTANHFSQELGAKVSIEGVIISPFSGRVDISGISCNSFILDANCDEIQVNGWEILRNHGQIKTASFNNLQWDVLGNYVGTTKNLKLEGIDIDLLSVESAVITQLNTTTGGFGPDSLKITSLRTRIAYNEALKIRVDTLIADSIKANGEFVIHDDFSIEALLNLDAYPTHFIKNLGFDLGQIIGQIQYSDSTIFIKNLRSSKGHFIEEGNLKIDLKEWTILGKTILDGTSINIDAMGTMDSAEGIAHIDHIGKMDFIVEHNNLMYVAKINSDKIVTNGIQIHNVEVKLQGDLGLNSCELKLQSNEIDIETVIHPLELIEANYKSNGVAQIKDSGFLARITDKTIETGSNTKVDWNVTADKYNVHFSSNFIAFNGLRLNQFEYEGDVKNISGHVSCEEVLILNNDRSSRLVSSLETHISNDEQLIMYSTWKSSKGVDGELNVIGEFEDELDLRFSMVTEPLSEDQTTGWFGIPIETEAIEIEGLISGMITHPKIALNTHSTDLKIFGENISDCFLYFFHEDGQNHITSQLKGLGELDTGLITVLGTFNLQSLDLTTSVNELPLSYINPLISKNSVVLDGKINGVFSIDGLISEPKITGNGNLDDCSVQVDYMGTKYYVNGNFNVEPDAIELNGLEVDDGNNGAGFLVGTILHNHFKDWNIDISLIAEETPIEIINIPYSPERYFYGTGKGVGDINVFGYDDHIVIEANLETSEGTKFALPMDVVSSSDWSSFVEIKDGLEKSTEKSSNENQEKNGTDVSLDINLEITPSSEARIVFNSELGDEITGRCKGHIHLDLHDLERLEMFGDLEIVEGDYAFNLKNIISKKFEAIPGGTIQWFGDPYNAHIDISTLYKTRASLRPILPEITDASKYNIELGLNLRGELMRPGILFDISIPEASEQYRAALASIFSNEEELNRQSVSLLVINSFLPSTWHASSVGSTGIQESSSELITAQIGHWLSGISDDVNIGIDYDSAVSTGDEAAIAVAISTQLFNDRLHIEGEVGTQILYSGTTDDFQIQDIKIKYDLKEDGTIQLTGYSTQRATVPGLEGESLQGVGILFNKDFDRIKDLFKSKSKNN